MYENRQNQDDCDQLAAYLKKGGLNLGQNPLENGSNKEDLYPEPGCPLCPRH